MTQTMDIALTVDATGLNCPLPLLKAKQGLKQIEVGQCLSLVATDPGSMRDLSTFAELSGHQLLEASQDGEIFSYVLKKTF